MRHTGFTLIELLVVVLIMGILTSIALPQYRKAMDRARAAEAMQLMPALFEARERWMAEHQCNWIDSNPFYRCADGETLSGLRELDIEIGGSVPTTGINANAKTDKFNYWFIGNTSEKRTGTNQKCVMAVPQWGVNRGFQPQTGCMTGGVQLFYGGSEFYCVENQEGACEALNIAPPENIGKANVPADCHC